MRYSLILLLFWVAVAQATIYRWVDRDGSTHFSDQAQPGAIVIREQDLPLMNPTSAHVSVATPVSTQSVSTPTSTIRMISPTDQATINRSAAPQVTVVVMLQPACQAGEMIEILLDGKVVASGTESKYTLTGLDRGRHLLQAHRLDGTAIIAQTMPITIYVHQPHTRHLLGVTGKSP